MQSKQTLGSAIDGAVGPSKGRDLATARREAEDALERYAALLRAWNAPDDDHTRHQLRALVENAIESEFVA